METENDDLESKMEEYEAIEQIGRGAFLVLRKRENSKYVLKKIYLSKQTDKSKRIATQEMNLIAKLRHPYILEYEDAWVDKGSCICIVTNYCENGNIAGALKKARRAYFSEEKICKWLTQLLLAIDYLHSHRVLHRDIKLSNVFITEENDILLGDFGLAKLLNEEGLASSVAGTPNYMCPELLADLPYGYKSDIWSLGCCMFEIAAHQQAFRAPDMAGLINKINRSLISPMPIVYSSNLKQIIKSMLRKSPEHRPTAAELLRHPHLQPYLLRCHSPSAAFLPVKSPPPNSTTQKMKKPSPSSSLSGKDSPGREATVKQKDLLPLFEESTDKHQPNLLDDDFLIEYQLVTKRVDPTSFNGKISHDSEVSTSGDANETVACNGDYPDHSDSSSPKESVGPLDNPTSEIVDDPDSSSLKESVGPIDNPPSEIAVCKGVDQGHSDSSSLKESVKGPHDSITKLDDTNRVIKKTRDAEPLCNLQVSEDAASEIDAACSNNVVALSFDENMPLLDKVEPKSSSSIEKCLEKYILNIKEISSEPTQIEKEDSKQTDRAMNVDSSLNDNDETNAVERGEHPPGHRADALEILLELCAKLLKQDKFDELSGILKPFSDDAVSSRDTAIWLTKTLMNAQKFPKES